MANSRVERDTDLIGVALAFITQANNFDAHVGGARFSISSVSPATSRIDSEEAQSGLRFYRGPMHFGALLCEPGNDDGLTGRSIWA